MPEILTAVDARILGCLQRDSSLSTAEIADRVGLSQSPCWRRIRKLHEEGYIKAEVTVLNPDKFGPSVVIYGQLKMLRLNETEAATFRRTVQGIPEIIECYTLFGETDVMLKVLAPNIKWYQEFTFNTILKLPGVKDVRSIATLSEVKCTTQIPLPFGIR
jgi:Lrp/AsnC family transcriptional regulator